MGVSSRATQHATIRRVCRMPTASLSTASPSETALPAGAGLRPDEAGASSIGDPPRPGEGEDTIASRQCGRCRLTFPGDPTLHPTALPEWWLCAPCRLALLGPNSARPAPTLSHATIAAHDAR
jgi:hypothetical protein